jgi:hypothetical protein
MARVVSSPQSLSVRRTFEPNRLAPECLAAAYEQVAPLSRRPRVVLPLAPPHRAGEAERRKEAA